MTDLDDALKNGTALPASAVGYQPPPQLVAMAQQILDGVMSGQIRSLAAVTVGPAGQISWPICGSQGAEILAGAEFLRDDLKVMMRGQGKPSKILRAG